MIYYFDIDNTICKLQKGCIDYTQATPIKGRIKKINALYNKGHKIHYWTSRGVGTGKDWLAVTMEQFKEWGVKYHSLKMDKPIFDRYIGDKCTNILDFINEK